MNASIQDDIAANIRISDIPGGPSTSAAPSALPPSLKQIAGPSFGAPAKVEPFLLLAKSARGAGAAKLVEQATGAPGVFVFGELLEVNAIKELAKSPEHASHYNLLTVFAYGTWQDYKAQASSLPSLKENQIQKLKQLSLMTYASKSRILPYDMLMQHLEIATIHELEDLIIEAFYADLLTGRLDQRLSRLSVDSVAGRDVNALDEIAKGLAAWNAKIGSAVEMLDSKIAQRRQYDAAMAQRETQQSNNIKRVIQELQNPENRNQSNNRDTRSPAKTRQTKDRDEDYKGRGGGDDMDVDDENKRSTRTSTRKRNRQ